MQRREWLVFVPLPVAVDPEHILNDQLILAVGGCMRVLRVRLGAVRGVLNRRDKSTSTILNSSDERSTGTMSVLSFLKWMSTGSSSASFSLVCAQ